MGWEGVGERWRGGGSEGGREGGREVGREVGRGGEGERGRGGGREAGRDGEGDTFHVLTHRFGKKFLNPKLFRV